MNLNEFIDELGNAAIKYYPKYRVLPSLCIAQALLESNKADYRKGLLKLSGLADTCYNYYGMKWVNGCGCDYKEYKTQEQRKDGSYYAIIARFRKYSSPEEGVKGWYDFLNYRRYENLKGVVDYKKACELIALDGWATSLTYSENLIKRIEYLHLYRYDNIALGYEDAPASKKETLPTLRRGMSDKTLGASYIESWQRCLSLGGFKCKIDGIFGSETEKAVNAYRKYKGLAETGIIDAELWDTISTK